MNEQAYFEQFSGESVVIELTESEYACYNGIIKSGGEGVVDSDNPLYKTFLSLRDKGLITLSVFSNGGVTNPLDGYPKSAKI